MPNKKITQLSSAEATAAAILPVVVSGANQQLSVRDLLAGLGIPQYVETTCRATATIVNLPADSNIFDIYVKPLVASSATDGGTNVNVGRDSDATYFAVVAVSGVDTAVQRVPQDFWSLTARLQRTSGAVVAAAPTATANANFIVGIGYFRV